jgi:hypothetical protein
VPLTIATASDPVDETQPDVAAAKTEEAATEPEKPAAEEPVVVAPTAEAPAKSGHARVDSAIEGMVPDTTADKEPVVDKLNTVTEVAPVAEAGSEVA